MASNTRNRNALTHVNCQTKSPGACKFMSPFPSLEIWVPRPGRRSSMLLVARETFHSGFLRNCLPPKTNKSSRNPLIRLIPQRSCSKASKTPWMCMTAPPRPSMLKVSFFTFLFYCLVVLSQELDWFVLFYDGD